MAKPFILLLVTIVFVNQASSLFCSTSCMDYKIGCQDETANGCLICANTIYNLNANTSSATPCTLLSQRTIVANDLPNIPSMPLTGFTSSKTTSVTCTNYTFSGQYTNQDYLFKNYTAIALNHYAVVIRFSIGYIGTWQISDQHRLSIFDSNQASSFDFGYYCGKGGMDTVPTNQSINDYVENINNQPTGVNSSDCIRIKEFTLEHNTSYLALNFTALTSQSDPNIQFWGIKQIIIVTKDCHQNCLTCFGALNSQCITCGPNYYLQGNACLPACDSNLFIVADAKICVNQCPSKYYAFLNTTAIPTSKHCLNCQQGCSMCSEYSTCQVWENQQAHTPNIWKDKMQFWIFLIILLCSLIILAIYKMVKKPASSEIEQNMISKSDDKNQVQESNQNGTNENKQKINNDSMAEGLAPNVEMIGGDTLWFNELVELQPAEVKIRGRRKRGRLEDSLSINGHFDTQSNMNL